MGKFGGVDHTGDREINYSFNSLRDSVKSEIERFLHIFSLLFDTCDVRGGFARRETGSRGTRIQSRAKHADYVILEHGN